MLGPDRVELDSARWVTLGIHGLFLVLLVLAVVRADASGALGVGLLIAAWYIAGMYLRRTRSATFAAVWVLGLSAVWSVATLAVAPDFVWLAFPLFFLLLFLLSTPIGLVAVAIVTIIAVVGLDHDGNLEVGEVVGPTIGAGFAIVFTLAYRALANEHRRTKQLLAELVETRGRL
ncbi:MAG: sensor histidine kinase, partial [Acidimicrobiia bacterium]|nr:sensor histidine kinase [Acidimicrobiia bacterium]